jgi:hypothetical protein
MIVKFLRVNNPMRNLKFFVVMTMSVICCYDTTLPPGVRSKFIIIAHSFWVFGPAMHSVIIAY